jgi:hypothetical protein
MVRLKSKVGVSLIDDERGLTKTDHCRDIRELRFLDLGDLGDFDNTAITRNSTALSQFPEP